MNLDFVCTLFQPIVDAMQSLLALAWTPLGWFGIAVPPVASWFQPLLSCTLT